jgi:hypothetical protein
MYRLTGEREYQEKAGTMFTAISNAAPTEHANAMVKDVTQRVYPVQLEDRMEVSLIPERVLANGH